MAVKTILFKSFCVSFYGMVLWKYFTAGAINRLRSCYRKCMKTFLVTPEVTVTAMLVQLGLPTFDTLLHNSHVRLAGIVITVLLQNSSYYILSFLRR